MDLTGLFIKGFIIGLSVAAPIGPVNIEIMRRALDGRFTAATFVGLGAVMADSVYITLVCLGANAIVQIRAVSLLLQVGGASLLAWLSLSIIMDVVRKWRAAGGKDSADLLAAGADSSNGATDAGLTPDSRSNAIGRAWLMGFLMCLGNPLTIGLWLGIAGDLSSGGLPLLRLYPVFLSSVFAGCLFWVLLIVNSLRFVRRLISERIMLAVSFLAGVFLLFYGIRMFVRVGLLLFNSN